MKIAISITNREVNPNLLNITSNINNNGMIGININMIIMQMIDIKKKVIALIETINILIQLQEIFGNMRKISLKNKEKSLNKGKNKEIMKNSMKE